MVEPYQNKYYITKKEVIEEAIRLNKLNKFKGCAYAPERNHNGYYLVEFCIRECFGKQDSNIAINFPYNCEECKFFELCRKETLKRIAESLKERYGEWVNKKD